MKHNVVVSPAARKAHQLHIKAARFLQAGQFEQGITLLKEAASLAPDNKSVLDNLMKAQIGLAQNYLKLRHFDKAEAAYGAVLEHDKDFIPALMGMGVLMNQTMRTDGALEYFHRVLSLKPDHAGAWSRAIALLEFRGDLTEASEKIREARSHQGQDDHTLDLIEARLLQRQKKYGEAVVILEKMEQSAAVCFQLGKSLDSLERPDEAFVNFEKANELAGESFAAQKIDKQIIPARIEKLAAVFTNDFVGSWNESPQTNSAAPVFLVGFPRSGTTLLDQILSSHPAITVAEEKQALAEVRRRLGDDYPENLATLTPEKIEELQQLYFEIHGYKQGAEIFVDKMPLNLLDAGLAHRIFPQAKFILAQRHPFDCVLSCFMQEFTLNMSMIHFLSLEDAASFYDRAFSLWEQYCDLLPLQVHYIRYEDVVSDFKPTVAAMLEFLGQPWDDAVLAYDKTARQKSAINTPSYHQVTEKIYDSARYRWLRYKDHMMPVFARLAPWAEKYGYGTGTN